ncbi:hypothetical protein GCM10020219_077520 [Nonomuraea dietziae]
MIRGWTSTPATANTKLNPVWTSTRPISAGLARRCRHPHARSAPTAGLSLPWLGRRTAAGSLTSSSVRTATLKVPRSTTSTPAMPMATMSPPASTGAAICEAAVSCMRPLALPRCFAGISSGVIAW